MMKRLASLLALFVLGYVCGAAGMLQPASLLAQLADDQGPSLETTDKVRAAHDALLTAQNALETEELHEPATTQMNTFAVMAGGIDAVDDLETGRGVDPVTFAALYAGLATEEIKPDLGQDAKGRLTYKNRVVQMYSVSHLKKVFARQEALASGRLNRGN